MRMKYFLILSTATALLSSSIISYAITDSQKTCGLAAGRIVDASRANQPINKEDIRLYQQYREHCTPIIQQQADAALATQGLKIKPPRPTKKHGQLIPKKTGRLTIEQAKAQAEREKAKKEYFVELQKNIAEREQLLKQPQDLDLEEELALTQEEILELETEINLPEYKNIKNLFNDHIGKLKALEQKIKDEIQKLAKVKPPVPLKLPTGLTEDGQKLIKEAMDFIKTANIFDLLSKLNQMESGILEMYNIDNPDIKGIEVLDYIIAKLKEKITEKTSKPETLSAEDKQYVALFKLPESSLIDLYIRLASTIEEHKNDVDPTMKALVATDQKRLKLVEDVVRAKGLAEKVKDEIDKINAAPAKPKEGEPGFIGPLRPPKPGPAKPKPGEPGFIGPLRPTVPQPQPKPKPGEPGFIGPLRPPVPQPQPQPQPAPGPQQLQQQIQQQAQQVRKTGEEEEYHGPTDPVSNW